MLEVDDQKDHLKRHGAREKNGSRSFVGQKRSVGEKH